MEKLFENTIKKETIWGGTLIEENIISGDVLRDILPQLKEFEAFKETSILDVIDLPYLEMSDGKVYEVGTLKLEDIVFGGKCYIHSITKSPKPLDMKTIHNPIKDNMVITPTMYHPHDFKPINRLVLEFNPLELEEEGIEPTLNKIKEALTTKKEEYTTEPEYQFLIRGIFGKISNKEETIRNGFGNPILNEEDRKYIAITYIDYVVDEKDEKSIKVELIKKYIPKEYASKYIKELDETNKNSSNEDNISIIERNSRRNDKINNIFKKLKIEDKVINGIELLNFK